jgi:hypothetical protein
MRARPVRWGTCSVASWISGSFCPTMCKNMSGDFCPEFSHRRSATAAAPFIVFTAQGLSARRYLSLQHHCLCAASQTTGYWRLPTYGEDQDIYCVPPVADDELHVNDLEKFVIIDGAGYREVGLSWEFVPADGENRTHPYGYLDIAVRTRQDEVRLSGHIAWLFPNCAVTLR